MGDLGKQYDPVVLDHSLNLIGIAVFGGGNKQADVFIIEYDIRTLLHRIGCP